MTPASPEIRQQVLDLRRTLSLREVAKRTGLQIGTVKTWCSRSGTFRDNEAHRAMFCMPPIKPSAQTMPAVPAFPKQKRVTGDDEIDAVLWLRSVISTGHAALIEQALEMAKKIQTPLEDLEKRYLKHLVSSNPECPIGAAFGAFGFADLEGLAKRTVEKDRSRNEAVARFGDNLFVDTTAEEFCVESLADLERKQNGFFDDAEVDARFLARPDLMPHTLDDCLRELAFWDDLYRLRNAADDDYGGDRLEVSARSYFAFQCLARIRPRDRAEALAAFKYIVASDRMGFSGTDAILENLIR